MKTTLSKGADVCLRPSLPSAKEALPGTNGLYGKKPVAKIEIAMGISRFAMISSSIANLGNIVQACLMLSDGYATVP